MPDSTREEILAEIETKSRAPHGSWEEAFAAIDALDESVQRGGKIYFDSTRMIRASRLGMCAHCEDLIESRKEMRDSTREEILLEIEEKADQVSGDWDLFFAKIGELNRALGDHEPINTLELIREGREERDEQLDRAIFGDTTHATHKR